MLKEKDCLKSLVKKWHKTMGGGQMINELLEENKELKMKVGEQQSTIQSLQNENELLKDEIEQCRAVLENRWSEYLKKKGIFDE